MLCVRATVVLLLVHSTFYMASTVTCCCAQCVRTFIEAFVTKWNSIVSLHSPGFSLSVTCRKQSQIYTAVLWRVKCDM